MATWEDIKALIQARADAIDNPGAYGLRTPGDPIEVNRNQQVTPGGSWGETAAFEIYLKGIAEWLDDSGISELAAIKAKLNELISSYAQFKSDYDALIVPTTAADVDPVP